jgi:hypothetical protein
MTADLSDDGRVIVLGPRHLVGTQLPRLSSLLWGAFAIMLPDDFTVKTLLVGTGLLWGSIGGFGATIVSDVLTVFNGAGAIVGQVGVNEDGSMFGVNAAVLHTVPNPSAAEVPTEVYYINDITLGNPLRFGLATALLEFAGGPVSDVFGVVNVGTTTVPVFVLGFASDSEAMTVAFPFTSSLIETGAPVSAAAYLAQSLQTAGYTATFVSDPSEVPEPGTMALIGGGLLSVIGLQRTSRSGSVVRRIHWPAPTSFTL